MGVLGKLFEDVLCKNIISSHGKMSEDENKQQKQKA